MSLSAAKTGGLIRMPSRAPRWLLITVALAALYLDLPLIAGFFAIGDKRGPLIYPMWLHAELYQLGWQAASHEATKPRLPSDPPPRPLFYGL